MSCIVASLHGYIGSWCVGRGVDFDEGDDKVLDKVLDKV